MERFLEVPGNEDHLYVRASRSQPIGEAAAAHLRHDHVGKQEMHFHFITHSDSNVGDPDEDVFARGKLFGSPSRFRFLAKIDNRCFEGELAATLHRIACVYGQIQDELSELPRVHFDVSALLFVVQMTDHTNVLTDEPEQRSLEIGDERIDFDDAWLKRLPAAKCEELSGQNGGTA